MLHVYNFATTAIDDPDTAVAEILEGIEGKTLLKNSVGIIAAHFEYIENKTVAALSQALPFDTIGCTVLGCAINGCGGLEQLTLTVLTSDEDEFITAMSEPIRSGDFDAPIEKVYADAKASLSGKPALIFSLAPIMADVSGDQMLKKLDQIGGGIPVFGTLSNDISEGYVNSYVFRNGKTEHTSMAVLLIRGKFAPRFYTTAIASRNIQQQNAVVTGSEGYLVTSINNIPVLEFFRALGITQTQLASISLIPLLVNLGDGTAPFASSMYNASEAGVYCGCAIPKGATVAFAELDRASVLETAAAAIRLALADVEQNGASGIIAIPCFSRPLMLSPNMVGEIDKTLEVIGDKVPFALIYSGGEMCPVYNQQRGIVNRFHNLTYTLMVF